MIVLENVDVHHGTFQALHGVSIRLDKGEVIALVGRNGAGKSTLLKTLAGWLKCSRGELTISGQAVRNPTPETISRKHVVLVPEDRQIFPWLSVEENLRIAAVAHPQTRWTRDDAYAFFPRLYERRSASGAALSGGEQQMLAVARGLLCQPDCLLLDEPTEGLAPVVVDALIESIRAIAAEGIGIMIVEQNAKVPERLAERFYVLDAGAVAWAGTRAELSEQRAIVDRILSV